jgi:arabinose-5-phosphate isomerase
MNNLAPTTSTTVVMALGDALAIALSELKGFNAQNFALYHPKGSLGKRLLTTAGNLIKHTREEVSVKQDENVKKVLWTITKNHLGAAAVVDGEGRLVGLITDGDIRRGLERKENILQSIVTEIMTANPICVDETMLAVDIFQLMQERKISVVPVVDKEKELKSIISLHDIVDAGIVN